jgi:hypothetical protein
MRWKPVLTLVAISSFLPELLSGSTPLEAWLSPPVLPLFILGYGVPVLLIRELAVRQNLGAVGIVVAGLGYGLVNEGLFAGTIFRETGVPIPLFDSYGYSGGVSWAWAVLICTWHAVTSVWLPVAVTERRFGRAPWLGRWGLGLATLVTLGLPCLTYLWQNGRAGLPSLVAQWAVILALAILAQRFTRQGGNSRAKAFPLVLGLMGGPAFVLAMLPAALKVPPVAQVATLAAIVALWGLILWRRHLAAPYPVGWFAIGWYVAVAAFSATHLLARSPQTLAADVVVLAALWLFVRRVPA